MDGYMKLQRFFQILGDSSRLRIINFIGEQERSVSEIVTATQMSQPLVSHHLRTLKENQILETQRVGPFTYYKLKNKMLLEVLGLFTEVLPDVSESDQREMLFPCPPWFRNFFDGQ